MLLGLELTLELPCLRLAGTGLTSAQISQLLTLIQNLLGAIGGALPTAG